MMDLNKLKDISQAVTIIIRLERNNALLRQALEAVEWQEVEDRGTVLIWCPWCKKSRLVSEIDSCTPIHKPDCLRQRALGLVNDG